GDTRNSDGGAENEVRQPEIQRRGGVTGRGVERERAARRRALRKRELPAQQQAAEFDVVRATTPGQRAVVLKRIHESEQRHEQRVAEVVEALNEHARQPEGLLVADIHTTDRVAWEAQIVG